MSTSSTVTAPRPWRVPTAEIPVRGRVRLPHREADGPGAGFDPYVGAAFLAAATLTTGTVVVRDWPRPAPASGERPTDDRVDDRIRHLFAGFGVYVVRTVEGLTATSRSTSGELRGGRYDLTGVPRLTPLAAVLAAVAEGPTTLTGVPRADPVVLAVVDGLRAAGGSVDRIGDDLRIDPTPLTGTTWVAAGDLDVALAGIVLGLRVPGVRLDDIGPVLRAIPAFDDLWLRLLWADEHLLPGTSGGH